MLMLTRIELSGIVPAFTEARCGRIRLHVDGTVELIGGSRRNRDRSLLDSGLEHATCVAALLLVSRVAKRSLTHHDRGLFLSQSVFAVISLQRLHV